MKPLISLLLTLFFISTIFAQNQVDSIGNIGIGTLNPNYPLEVFGQSMFHGKLSVDSLVTLNDSLIVKAIRIEDDLHIENDLVLRKYINPSLLFPQKLYMDTDGKLISESMVHCLPNGTGNYYPIWETGSNKIFTFCPEANIRIGINTIYPLQPLHVNGNGFINGQLGVGIQATTDPLMVNGVITSVGNNGKLLRMFSHGTDNYNAIRSTNSNGDHVLFKIQTGNNNGATPVRDAFVIDTDGNIGIGTSKPLSLLSVNGTITAKEIEVTLNGFPDFVFDNDYNLMPLKEVDLFITKFKHLPNIPDEKTVVENGLNLGEMDALLLQKVEELTLYIIELNKKIEEQEKKIEYLQMKVK